jgi:drug/metabolite transporter (DMT)-like permease
MNAKTRGSALTEGVAAGVLFGSASIFIRFLQGLDAFSIAFWRLIIACLALSAILLFLGRSFSLSLVKGNVKGFFILSFFLAFHFMFFIFAVKDTTILNATVLVNTTPVFSVLVSNYIFKLRPSRTAILGLTISFAGVCVIAFAEAIVQSGNLGGVSSSLKGDLEAVLAASVEALYLNYGRRIRSQMNILSIMLPVYALTAFIVAVLSLPARSAVFTLPVDEQTVLSLVGLGLLPTAVAHTLYFSSLSNLKSFETATMALLEPVGATLLGVAIFQEMPAPMFAFGVAMILAGIVFVGKKGSQG